MKTNKDLLIEYLRTKLDGKPKLLIRNYLLLGYDEIEAFKRTIKYLKSKKRYTMYIRMQRILIEMGYYRKATVEDLFERIKGKSNKEFIKHRFVTYINCCDFDEWLEKELEGN